VVGMLFIVTAALLWALDTLVRYPLVDSGINPVVIVFFEHLILTFLFLPKLANNLPLLGSLKLSHGFYFLMVGAGGSAVATISFTSAFIYLNPSLVILLQKFQPVVAILMARWILKEPLPRPFLFWALICLIGALLISGPDIEKVIKLMSIDASRLASEGAILGYLLVLTSVFFWGASTVFGKKLTLEGFKPINISAGRFLVGLLAIIFFVPWGDALLFKDKTDYVRLFIMVIFSGALAMWFYYQGMQRLQAKVVTILEMFFPLMAIIVNYVFLGKQLSDIQLLGGGLLLIGAFVLQFKKY
jgi:drug/metabolite transporter (DMT)-like permease